MNTKAWLLIAVSAAGDTGLTPIQLQKSLFIIGKSLKLKNYYNFTPYSYGPFDQQIYIDAEILSAKLLLNVTYDKSYRYPRYIISNKGLEEAKDIRKKVKDEKVDFIFKTVGFIKSLSFKQLLKIVYETYPSFAVNSIFKG